MRELSHLLAMDGEQEPPSAGSQQTDSSQTTHLPCVGHIHVRIGTTEGQGRCLCGGTMSCGMDGGARERDILAWVQSVRQEQKRRISLMKSTYMAAKRQFLRIAQDLSHGIRAED